MAAAEPGNVPLHVAIIMDGNGRWARQHGLARAEGHRAGARAVQKIVEVCPELGVGFLTLYAFSTENWHRPATEVRGLMHLLRTFLDHHLDDLQEQGIRLNVIGRRDRLPRLARRSLTAALAATRDNPNGVLTLALNYGSRDEIVRAARRLAALVRDGGLEPESITEELLTQNLDTADLPDPDLIIRTSGEFRLSNFLLWQGSYAEFWVTNTYWPDFTPEEFRLALADYGKRRRRFGGLSDA